MRFRPLGTIPAGGEPASWPPRPVGRPARGWPRPPRRVARRPSASTVTATGSSSAETPKSSAVLGERRPTVGVEGIGQRQHVDEGRPARLGHPPSCRRLRCTGRTRPANPPGGSSAEERGDGATGDGRVSLVRGLPHPGSQISQEPVLRPRRSTTCSATRPKNRPRSAPTHGPVPV